MLLLISLFYEILDYNKDNVVGKEMLGKPSKTQMRCGNKIENKEYRSHLILEILSSSICRFYSFIEQIFSN